MKYSRAAASMVEGNGACIRVAGNRGICTGLTFILIRGQKYGGKEDREVEECQDRCQGGDRHHRRERALFDGRVDEHTRDSRENAVRRSFGGNRAWHAGRKACGVSGAPRARAPYPAKRD